MSNYSRQLSIRKRKEWRKLVLSNEDSSVSHEDLFRNILVMFCYHAEQERGWNYKHLNDYTQMLTGNWCILCQIRAWQTQNWCAKTWKYIYEECNAILDVSMICHWEMCLVGQEYPHCRQFGDHSRWVTWIWPLTSAYFLLSYKLWCY